MKKFIYTFAILFLLTNCSSEDDSNDPNNRNPGPFSVTILDVFIDGADIEWTEAIDLDDDPVTYSIYLNEVLISTGGTTLNYAFTGLEPETVYDGYILADDGNGGTSQANFFFETEPETLVFTVDASDWIWDSSPEAGGTREVRGAGFEIPYYENAVSYQIEILNYSITWVDGTVDTQTGVYTWTNESQNDPIYVLLSDSSKYVASLTGISINTVNPDYNDFIDSITSREGEAQVIITF
ncbi:hypothetical protein H7U19_12670 [Hyunsoonleella sp. SJ7]|uniref:Fibronectin type-III domain-containing protein n=1 Tax=Hyunsoonleella aquatilis TaxID=2762758 RepID=A0A923KIV5_9FLAO|nr:hypothetical protein [Hyunsoonleella aquatilis]MBC3759264.1 hypothetical protein [Hyunsoonleella aquatilis]